MTDKERRKQFNLAIVLMITLAILTVLMLAIVVKAIVSVHDAIEENLRKEETISLETEDVLVKEMESTVHNEPRKNRNVKIMPETIFEANPIIDVISEENTEKECIEEEEAEAEEEKGWIVELTEEEFRDFCILVFAESGAEIEEGQVAVAATVINRMESPEFPNTFYGVMNQSGQFSCVKNGYICSSIRKYEDLPQKTIDAVKRALEGEDPTEELLWKEAEERGLDPEKYALGGALYFYNPRGGYYDCAVQIDIGNHCFQKLWRG